MTTFHTCTITLLIFEHTVHQLVAFLQADIPNSAPTWPIRGLKLVNPNSIPLFLTRCRRCRLKPCLSFSIGGSLSLDLALVWLSHGLLTLCFVQLKVMQCINGCGVVGAIG
jgi:hypothetical protein